MKKDPNKRSLEPNDKLPRDSWLFSHAATFRVAPRQHPPNCSWCETKFRIVKKFWRICSSCDEEKKDK